ncbi:hypothetical protein AOX63_08435 [Pseudomonas sp. ADP]|uniref:hypothetical protein n=1 Tax=Pseudomonas sp. ADPe TaxID=2774873 RepID=UPI0007304135|nr:hypothetical protein [Pseudomonas sp. ADPe]KSW21495.1 hypothetical protein AOX63_08435 [Pseudomonas sp. ADP]
MQLRITQEEQELLRKKSIEINQALMKHGKPPLSDSKLLHEILLKSMSYAKLSPSGEVVIDPE